MSGLRSARALLLAGVVVVGAAACGNDTDRDARRDAVATPASTESGAASYVGLTKRAAIRRADVAGVTWRITREDDEFFPATLDYDPDRLNLEIDDGTVTAATFG
ncbi:MAG: hypothetical protein ACKOA9_00705 [Actinomycetota bacterium]